MKESLYYDGIYRENTINWVREIVNVASLEEKPKYYNWTVKPHAHKNLFQIFLVETGSIQLLINDLSINVESLSFITIPKNVLHGFKMSPDTTGWVITLSDIALERMLALDTDIIFKIDEIIIARMDLNDVLFENLYVTMHKCIDEYNGRLPGKDFALEYLVGMLLIRLYRIPAVQKQTLKSSDNAYKIYYRRFLQLIKESNSFKRSIVSYAEALAISSGHLNRICKNISGKSPKDILIEYFINEAKKKLASFEFSIAEISFKLGFEDPGYFSRLFKFKTGVTPGEYRRRIAMK